LNLVWSTLSLAHGQEPGTVNCGSSLLRIASGSTVYRCWIHIYCRNWNGRIL
jgi:hypothetical protein